MYSTVLLQRLNQSSTICQAVHVPKSLGSTITTNTPNKRKPEPYSSVSEETHKACSIHVLETIGLLCRKDTIVNLGTAETKLLYTLHWVLLDAAEEKLLSYN